MELFDKITKRLGEYLVKHLGFVDRGDNLEKKLSASEFIMAPRVAKLIMQRKAYSWVPDPLDAISSLLIENYVAATVMEDTIDKVDFTDEERAYFTCPEDGDDDAEEDAYCGWAEIESWVSGQNIYVDRSELSKFVSAVTNP